jgi:hypothetical protein
MGVIRVRYCELERIRKDRTRFLERHAVLADVRFRFACVPLEVNHVSTGSVSGELMEALCEACTLLTPNVNHRPRQTAA